MACSEGGRGVGGSELKKKQTKQKGGVGGSLELKNFCVLSTLKLIIN